MRIYHGTQYHESIKQSGFDITKSYAQRNDKLGAGEAIYFSYDYDVASDYSTANANESFHPCVIDELEQSDPVAGYLLRQLYENGTEVAWEALENHYEEQGGWAFLREYYNDKDYGLNDVQAISEYIRGSRVIEEDYEEDVLGIMMGGGSSLMPEPIREDAKKMGIKTIPSDYGIVIVSVLKEDIRIKKIGKTNNAPKEAAKAKEEGYHALEFMNQHSVDGELELAIFDTTKIEILKLIDEIKPWEEVSIEYLRLIIKTIISGKNNLNDILGEVYEPGMIRYMKAKCEDNLKNILGIMRALKLINYEDEKIVPVVRLEEIEKQIKKSKSILVDNLIREINENKFKEAVKSRKSNFYNKLL